jgi:hypothetical protein
VTTVKTPGKRGYKGLGGGAFSYMKPPVMHRGPSDALAGLNPWVVGGGVTSVGVPLGRIQSKYGKVGVLHCDPISWFQRAKLISSPSMYILGLNGLGKSSLGRREVLGMGGYGVPSLVLADIKGEYVKTITALGGQVIRLGRRLGCLNVLDLTEVYREAQRLSIERSDALIALARSRRQAAVESLFSIDWGRPATGDESHILAEAMRVADDDVKGRGPEMKDLLKVITAAPQSVQDIALCRGDMDVYRAATRAIEATLVAWVRGHGLGEVFSGPSTVHLRRGNSACIDISAIDQQDKRLRAAAMVASWYTGFTNVAISHALTDEGLEPYRPVNIVQDELWQALQLPGLVDQYDSLTRLDRHEGVSRILTSHSLGDSESLPNRADRVKAAGFFGRSGIKMIFGVEADEIPRIQGVLNLSGAEQEYLVNNTTQDSWDPDLDEAANSGHPGRGKILCKTGAAKAGIPFHLDLTDAEKTGLNDTNQHWNMR